MKIDIKEHIHFIRDLMSNKDQHKDIYVSVSYLELSTSTRCSRENDKWICTEVPCLKLSGVTDYGYVKSSGTRYIYQEDKVYKHLLDFYNKCISDSRNNKINSLLD